MRTFVAVFPPPEVQEALVEAALALTSGGSFRPTPPERVHLTLKFLGDVRREDLDAAVEALTALTDFHGRFSVETENFGVFPSTRRARVLWAGVGEGAQTLEALARDTETLLEGIGFRGEGGPYVPHLTLGRARRAVAFDPGGARTPDLRFTVKEVRLVESRPDGGGVTYATVATFPLRTGPQRAEVGC